MSSLDAAWRDLEQAIGLAAEDAKPHPAMPLIQKLRDLVTAERMAIADETVTTKHAGKHRHRLNDNPMEKRFADAWEEHQRGNTLAYLMCDDQRGRPPEPSQRDALVAATVVQWLGSPVGQAFLRDVGFDRVEVE